MYAYKRHTPYSHLDNTSKIDLFAFYGVFGLLHIIISESFYKHHTGQINERFIENVCHLWIEFIRYVHFRLDKRLYLWYLYIFIKQGLLL